MYKLDFYTSYGQFYIADKDSLQQTASDRFWTEEASKDRLAVEEGILGVWTACYGPVKAQLNVRQAENSTFDLSKYDHIVEAGLRIQSGFLQVIDCPFSNVELEINIPAGNYRVRVYSSNLDSVVGDEGDDFYEIEVWPGDNLDRTVLKRYN